MKWPSFIILAVLFGLLTWWVAMQLAAPVIENEYKETSHETAEIVKRINYHGLTGVVVLEQTDRGYVFFRDRQWCKL